MSATEVVFRVVDRAGDVHRVTAMRMVSGHERVVAFFGSNREEIANFVEPIAVMLDSNAESIERLRLEPGEVCTTVIQSTGLECRPIFWVTAASMVALVVMKAYELFLVAG